MREQGYADVARVERDVALLASFLLSEHKHVEDFVRLHEIADRYPEEQVTATRAG